MGWIRKFKEKPVSNAGTWKEMKNIGLFLTDIYPHHCLRFNIFLNQRK